MKSLPTVLALIALLWSSVAQADRHTAVVIESDAQIYKDVTHKQARALAGLIMIYGYRCDSISAVTPFAFSRGFHVYCNRWNYGYEVADKGGNWVVTLK